MNASSWWALADFLMEHESGIVKKRAGAYEFDIQCCRLIGKSGLEGCEKAGWVFFGEVEMHGR